MDKTTMIMLALPIVFLQFGLQIGALISMLKRKNLKVENKIIWALVILMTGIIGPVVYFAMRKGD